MPELRCLPQNLKSLLPADLMSVWSHATLIPLADILANPKYFLGCVGDRRKPRLCPLDTIHLVRATSTRSGDLNARLLESATVRVSEITADEVRLAVLAPGIEIFAPTSPYTAQPEAAKPLAYPMAPLPMPDAPARVLRAERYAPNPNAINGWRVVDQDGVVVTNRVSEAVARNLAGEPMPEPVEAA